MSGRLRELARQTVAIAEVGQFSNPSGTVVSIRDAVARESTLAVARESTLAAARRLGDDVACLVFASAKNPGGGFLGGAQAQEESIARSSALYPCLLAAPDFYAFHRAQRDLRYSDREPGSRR